MPKLRNKSNRSVIIRAIHPNAGVIAWYENELKSLLREATNDAVLMLTNPLAEPLPVGILVRDAAPKLTRVDKALKKWGDKWAKKFDKLSKEISARFAKRSFRETETALRAALKQAGFTVSFRPSKRVLESYKLVIADNVGLIRNLQQDLYNRIQQDTWASVRAGGDMATLSEKLHKSYGVSARRAALISRDQNFKAKAIIESTRRQELGLKKAIWQHSSAGKEPRPTHVAMDGKEFELDKGMYDSDENAYVFPGQLINCRCSSRAVIPGFDDEE